VILFGIIAGIPATIVAGPLFARYISKQIHATVPDYFQTENKTFAKDLPGFGTVVGIIFIPLALIILNTVSGAWLEAGTMRSFLAFIGHPFVALIIAVLLAFWLLGTQRGFSREEVQKIATKALEPAGIIILVTGAGGVFKQVLIDSGVGKILGEMMAASSLPPILLAFIAAAIIRIAQGSATVAMITAAGIIAPVVTKLEMHGPVLGLMVIAIAAGASIMSHVNDSGFWLIKQYFGLSEKDTLRSWTVSVTLIAVVGFLGVFVLSLFIR